MTQRLKFRTGTRVVVTPPPGYGSQHAGKPATVVKLDTNNRTNEVIWYVKLDGIDLPQRYAQEWLTLKAEVDLLGSIGDAL